jgi:hypothetical protein
VRGGAGDVHGDWFWLQCKNCFLFLFLKKFYITFLDSTTRQLNLNKAHPGMQERVRFYAWTTEADKGKFMQNMGSD